MASAASAFNETKNVATPKLRRSKIHIADMETSPPKFKTQNDKIQTTPAIAK
jgi:hypothetical protein